jgi:uncharacterized membrane protein YdjX (TVP38/TMEM64 family)
LAALPDPRRARNLRIAAVLGVVVVLAVAWRLGILQEFASPAQVKDTLVRLGPWGYVAFVVAYTLLQPFGVPGTVFVWAAPLIWPWPIAYALSMTGTMAASVVGFSFSRFIARDWVSARIPARFQRYNEALERRAFSTVALLRFIFWMPQPLHFFLGLSRVRFWTHFWGSLVGYAIPLFLVSFFGQKLLDWAKAAPPSVWIGVGVVAAVIAASAWVARRRAAAVVPPPAPRLE